MGRELLQHQILRFTSQISSFVYILRSERWREEIYSCLLTLFQTQIDNTRMCDTLLAGVVKLRPRLPNTPKLDQVMFNFWEGRLAILRYYFRYVRR